jgi:hypothetical protein
MQRLRTLKFFKNSRSKLKNKKPIAAVEFLFQAYPMVQVSGYPIWPDSTFSENATNIFLTSLILSFNLTCKESRWGAARCYQWRVRDLCLSAGPGAAYPRRVHASTSQCRTQPDAIHTYG